MKIAAVPETLLERLVNLLGLAPTPIVETFHSVILARAVMVATKIGVFEVLAGGALSAPEVAGALAVDERAGEKLLNVLVASRYLRMRGGRYALTPLARRWLLRSSPSSVHANMLLRFMEWQAVEALEDFVRTGRPLDVHAIIRHDQWEVYQRGMRALARISADEVVRRVPLPAGARAMLDVGGGHGHYAVAFCCRHPRLRATILDLPAAAEAVEAILAEYAMGDRVEYLPGDAVMADLGEAAWDLIFMSHLAHHLDDATNAALARRAARALRPGGVLAILEVLRPVSPTGAGQTGALLDLYFALTSNSGTWSEEEIRRWQVQAGLRPGKRIALRSAPGLSVKTATKPLAADTTGS